MKSLISTLTLTKYQGQLLLTECSNYLPDSVRQQLHAAFESDFPHIRLTVTSSELKTLIQSIQNCSNCITDEVTHYESQEILTILEAYQKQLRLTEVC